MRVWTTLIVLAALSAGAAGWSAAGIVDRLANSTMEVKHYVQDSGRALSGRIKSYYSSVKDVNRNMIDYVEDKSSRITNTLSQYIDKATATGKKLIDIVRPGGGGGETCPSPAPETHLSTPQLIALHGYRAEAHTVRTDDGYLLTVHRIPHSTHARVAPRKTVLLHHGLLGSSADWVLAGPRHSLAYALSDAGYDVWLANVRGNVYSRAHATLDPSSHAFWNFTWHEVARHDLPAVIDYIWEVKGSSALLSYVGHSMGTTVLFALLATRPEYSARLRAGFALAPIAYMSEVRSPVRLLAPYSRDLAKLLRLLGADEFLPQNWVLRWLADHACDYGRMEEALCENTLFVICGHDESQFNRTLLPAILGHTPAGASTKTLVHYAQEIAAGGTFQQFDYGREGNIVAYGSDSPPAYDLRRVKLPIALLSARKDWLAGEKDVARLYGDLPNRIEHYVVPLDEFNHIDFLWAKDAPTLVYNKLLRLLASEVNTDWL